MANENEEVLIGVLSRLLAVIEHLDQTLVERRRYAPRKKERRYYYCEVCPTRRFQNPQTLLVHTRMKHPERYARKGE
jgi:hypothetical protein